MTQPKRGKSGLSCFPLIGKQECASDVHRPYSYSKRKFQKIDFRYEKYDMFELLVDRSAKRWLLRGL